MSVLDASKTRSLEGGPSFSLRHRAFRALWGMTWLLLASWTPPPFHPWRRFLLRLFGAKVSQNAFIRGSAKVWYPPNLTMRKFASLGPQVICYNMARIQLQERAIVSQGVHLCSGTHDIDDPNFQLVTNGIIIGPDAWVAAEAFVGPGVIVGEGAVLGARAVAFSNLDAWGIYVGNPAIRLRTRTIRSS
jgi:putative colanic acid biosynthesis acetyltransferase WcaF